jgi:hypothetical protein
MPLRQPPPQARRQQQLLLAITPDEVLRHPRMVLTRADRPPFTQQPRRFAQATSANARRVLLVHLDSEAPRALAVARASKSGAAARMPRPLLLVHLSSERLVEPVRQDSSFAEACVSACAAAGSPETERAASGSGRCCRARASGQP